VVASVSWYFLLLKLRIETGVIWRNIYVPSYYHITLLLPKVVANSDANRKQKENLPTKYTNRSSLTAAIEQYLHSNTAQIKRTRKPPPVTGALITRPQINSFLLSNGSSVVRGEFHPLAAAASCCDEREDEFFRLKATFVEFSRMVFS